MACGHILQVGLLLRGAESLGTCPDEIRLSNQDRIRASPFFKATDVGARTLNDGRYLVLGFAFGQRPKLHTQGRTGTGFGRSVASGDGLVRRKNCQER